MLESTFAKEHFPNLSGYKLHVAQYTSFVRTWARFKRLAIGCIVMFFQQFMGCNGLDSNTTSLLATGVYGIVNCPSTLPALFFIDKVGRRALLMAGATGTCISLVIVGGILGGYGSLLMDKKSAGWAGIAFIYIYVINFSYSFGETSSIPPTLYGLHSPEITNNTLVSVPIVWVLPSEIFNLSIRSKAISITTSATWMCNFIIGLVTPDMLESITWGTYIFFAAFCLLVLVFTFFCIPETGGKVHSTHHFFILTTLEDMDIIFGDTAAHEEKKRIKHIEAGLHGTRIEEGDDSMKLVDQHAEIVM
ncbi:unnamed protein product [Penicillium salamii]|uniref:Major facilitator superfamily (MFS) profile domain-containing protein n=1 Tax=Penicillium salamii TaxID=1612424 RepID=A0A9W4I5P0_9EURO|nr:unnamed protein product [Penicillium salamii]CAG7958570.1 unnamed protein product [Penicillium salamii]CAG7959577.1 unnamed protein product [Penicillium salamii]CAG7987215.1 unnamed protein product [Penicillium salamii]CAG8223156.1 unnamed protein product [Penicillium salamii]